MKQFALVIRIGLMTLIAFALDGCQQGILVCEMKPAPGSDQLYRNGAVAADHPAASLAGLEILKQGGNAVDAAVATSFCLSVVRPYSCGIGGGGFMVIHIPARDGQPAKSVALNYRETCPAMVGPDHFIFLEDKFASRTGVHASGVPGTVAGLCHALKTYGTLDLKTVLQPAIRVAEEGFAADFRFVEAVDTVVQDLDKQPHMRALMGSVWTNVCREGKLSVGDVVRNPAQAAALRLIAEHGPKAFYEGEIAESILALMHSQGGTLTAEDLRGYAWREVQPLVGDFRGHQILSMPPPSSGGVAMQQVFGLLERKNAELGRTKHNNVSYVHLVAECFKHSFADRSQWLADPAFAPVPLNQLLEPKYLDMLASRIDLDRTQNHKTYGSALSAEPGLPTDGGTSHLCAIDSSGMAVSCTETINLSFGSLVEVPGYGFCLNNQMDDFTTMPGQANAFGLTQSDRNLPEPGKRPLSSMSPTIVLRNGKVELIAGASGGPRIITATTQCILNSLLFDMTPLQAVSEPRFHHQWMPNVLQVDQHWRNRSTLEELRKRGHEIGTITNESAVQMIRVTDEGVRAASDPRKGGHPAGY